MGTGRTGKGRQSRGEKKREQEGEWRVGIEVQEQTCGVLFHISAWSEYTVVIGVLKPTAKTVIWRNFEIWATFPSPIKVNFACKRKNIVFAYMPNFVWKCLLMSPFLNEKPTKMPLVWQNFEFWGLLCPMRCTKSDSPKLGMVIRGPQARSCCLATQKHFLIRLTISPPGALKVWEGWALITVNAAINVEYINCD